jgi:uncharacterized membrane protein YidH (DUF202 family)
MKTTLIERKNDVMKKMETASAMLTAAALPVLSSPVMMTTVYAASSGADLMKTIIKMISVLIIALGIVFAVLGLVHYAAANSEGDGPAKQKAMMQLASGVMIIVMSTLLNGQASNLANYVTSSIS